MVQLGLVLKMESRFRRGKKHKSSSDKVVEHEEPHHNDAVHLQQGPSQNLASNRSTPQSVDSEPEDYFTFPKKKKGHRRSDDSKAYVRDKSPHDGDSHSDSNNDGVSTVGGSSTHRRKKKKKKSKKGEGKSSSKTNARKESQEMEPRRQSGFGGGIWQMLTTGGEALVHKMEGNVDEIFEKVDVDGNGELDREELGELFQLLGMNPSKHELDLMFSQLNHDKDDVISKEEFCNWYKTSKDAIEHRKKKQQANHRSSIWSFIKERGSFLHIGGVGLVNHFEGKDVHEVFDAVDVDGNGELDHDEIRELFKLLGSNLTQNELINVFEQLDHNNDGTISKEEFCTWYEQSHEFMNQETEHLEPLVEEKDEMEPLDDTGENSSLGSGISTAHHALMASNRATLKRHLQHIDMVTVEVKKEVKSVVKFLAKEDHSLSDWQGAPLADGIDFSSLPLHEQQIIVKSLMERDRVVLMKTLDELQRLQIGIQSALDEVLA